jgi:hypothetical protein
MEKPEPALELIWGAAEIGKAIGRTRAQTYHLLEKGHLPAKNVGGRWVASLRALREHFEGSAAA